MQKFKIGDRVRVRQWDEMAEEFGVIGRSIKTPAHFVDSMQELCGETGTIRAIQQEPDETQQLWIDWDNEEDGNFRTRWDYDNGMFELIDEPKNAVTDNPKIVITTDGKTTTAKLYNNKSLCETAKARCSPDDKFDFNIGAKLAMDRLMKVAEDDTNAKTDDDVINVGDRVRIADGVHSTDVYDVYSSWIQKYAPEYAIHYAYGAGLEKVKLYYNYFVLKKAQYDVSRCNMLCLISISSDPISDCQPCYLIAEEHLRKVAQ